jgi:glycogen(starch) synthase
VRVLMLSWEYPPLVVGGVATHVHGLAGAMHRLGHEVVVFTRAHPDCADDEVVDGVRVLRADTTLPWLPDDFLAGATASINHHLVQLAAQLGDWRPEVVHAHDWLVAWAADTLRALLGVPMVATVHATERGRHGGHVPVGTPAAVNSVEWWLTYQARRVIACSRFMMHEVIDGFELPPDKVRLIPNGIDVSAWSASAGAARERLVVAWGRIQYEKGFQVLARAMATVRWRLPDVRCVIAGRGSYLPELQSQLDIEGVSDIVHLAGYVSDAELRELVSRAGCVVIPSLYEPFGIVALEGMAAGAPTIAARTGGLAEIIGGTGAGLLFEPGNHDELAERIVEALTDTTGGEQMCARAAELLRAHYTWDAVAAATVAVYTEVSSAD